MLVEPCRVVWDQRTCVNPEATALQAWGVVTSFRVPEVEKDPARMLQVDDESLTQATVYRATYLQNPPEDPGETSSFHVYAYAHVSQVGFAGNVVCLVHSSAPLADLLQFF